MKFPTATSPLFADLLDGNSFITSAELTPPRHFDLTSFMKKARIVSEYVDVVQINDHLLSKARMNNMETALHCLAEDIEPILQCTLRHKNRIAIQGDLLGYAASGIRNLIVLGGYPCRIGSDPSARDVNDLQCVEAIAKINDLSSRGLLFNGQTITPKPEFTLGAVEFPCKPGRGRSSTIDRVEKKIEAGARFIQMQAIFESNPLRLWMKEVVYRGLHKKARFLGAVFPFTGLERLHALREIPGLRIPSSLLKRIRENERPEESLAVTLELIGQIRQIEGISGIHIRSIGAENWVPRIMEGAGLGGALIY